jgi:hypothetical protein
MQSLIKLISKLASSMSDVGHALACQYSQHGVVEDGKQVRSMPHTELGMILMQRGIASMVQAILNGTITNDKFCLSRVKPLPFVSARPRGTEKVEYPCGRNAGARSSQEETNDQTTVEHPARQH